MVEVWVRPWRAEPATAATRRGRSQALSAGRNERRKFWNLHTAGHGMPRCLATASGATRQKQVPSVSVVITNLRAKSSRNRPSH